jgi:hypothetical protein
MALTGIVIGLGSAPTHEVVKALQAYKTNRQGSDVVQRPTGDGRADSDQATLDRKRRFRSTLAHPDYEPARRALLSAGFDWTDDNLSLLAEPERAVARPRFVALRRTG